MRRSEDNINLIAATAAPDAHSCVNAPPAQYRRDQRIELTPPSLGCSWLAKPKTAVPCDQVMEGTSAGGVHARHLLGAVALWAVT